MISTDEVYASLAYDGAPLLRVRVCVRRVLLVKLASVLQLVLALCFLSAYLVLKVVIDREVGSQSGHYQVIATWMGACLWTAKPSRYVKVKKVKVVNFYSASSRA